jgi:hypothetical protein
VIRGENRRESVQQVTGWCGSLVDLATLGLDPLAVDEVTEVAVVVLDPRLFERIQTTAPTERPRNSYGWVRVGGGEVIDGNG